MVTLAVMLKVADRKERPMLRYSAEQARLIRREAGVSTSTLAAVIDIDSTTLERWEQGRSTPRNLLQASRWQRVLNYLVKEVGLSPGAP